MEVDWRKTMAAAVGLPVTSWQLVGMEDYPLAPFNWSQPLDSLFDVAPLTDVSLNTSYAWSNITVPHGTLAFGCVIGRNRAGLQAVVSTDGIVYDVTPPTLCNSRSSVRDGFTNDDYDQQSILDALLANWDSIDYESGVKVRRSEIG